jgi:hypothetical protein
MQGFVQRNNLIKSDSKWYLIINLLQEMPLFMLSKKFQLAQQFYKAFAVFKKAINSVLKGFFS